MSSQPLYRDEDYLREQYWEEGKSLTEIADELGCATNTVRDWMVKHDIERRSISEAKKLKTKDHAHYFMNHNGHMMWRHHHEMVFAHQILAISEFGFEAVCENQVHHKNHIPWDNRPDNIELMSIQEHSALHKRKVTGIDRIRVAELYENGDISSRNLSAKFDISSPTVLAIHDEFYGGAA